MLFRSSQILKDIYEIIEIGWILASLTWIILDSYGIFSLYFDWVAAFINIVRGISVFMLFDGTRFYIQLIFRSLNDIKYFFLMFAHSTFGFGFLLMISSDEELAFTSIWGDSYDMNFGSYQDPGTRDYSLKYIVYFGVTMINVVLMLNLLISILGDSYHTFQIEQMIVDIHLKAKISRELQTMMFWADNRSILKCIRLCNYAFVEEEDEDWEGRIRYFDKKLDNTTKEITKNIQDGMKKIMESNKSAEVTTIENNKLMEVKINSIEAKIESIETRLAANQEVKVSGMSDLKYMVKANKEITNSKLETKIRRITKSMENKFSEISASMENKFSEISYRIKENNDLTTSKITDLNQKLEVILNILSK